MAAIERLRGEALADRSLREKDMDHLRHNLNNARQEIIALATVVRGGLGDASRGLDAQVHNHAERLDRIEKLGIEDLKDEVGEIVKTERKRGLVFWSAITAAAASAGHSVWQWISGSHSS